MLFSLRFLIVAVLSCGLAACGTSSNVTRGPGGTGNYKVGQPYQIDGQWYTPSEDFDYDETGIASWYGPGFHGKTTANGERYDSNELTAAHPTLPMPSLARVTNLDNGRSIVVRINDRGPYAAGRIIDMSRRSAQLLGFEQQGTAKVRVQVMTDESKAIAQAAQRYGARSPEALQVAGAAKSAPLPPVTPRPLGLQAVIAENLPPITPPPERMPPLPQQPRRTALQAESNVPDQPLVTQVKITQGTDIFVQAGAFTKQDNATKLRAKLSSIAPAVVVPAVVNGRSFYRVRLGPLATVDQADGVLRQVTKAGVTEPRIIVD